MLILRAVGLLLLVAIAICIGAYLITGDKRYSVLSVRMLRIGLAVALVFMGMLVLERLIGPIL
ncbi:MAG TPA: hypothetical protein VFW00_03295 [Rhodocyclaceae bacterium]|nr:hypothetical protein [Rhodocyclaceae bacterium]